MKMLSQFRREVFIMYELNHPHIIKLYNHFEDEKFFYLIMEIADGGNLFHKLYREKCFLERNAAQYFREVVLAVEYLHSHVPAIIHRDIKPENILLDKEGRIKLTDFGWSNYYSNDNPTLRFTLCGTLEYLPPEIVSETGHNTGADIWCLGILLFEMLTGSTPFASKGKDMMLKNIQTAKAKFPLSMPALAKDLISKLIDKEPGKRLSAKEIKGHPWLLEHPPIRETISQDCLPKILPSIEEFNKAIQIPSLLNLAKNVPVKPQKILSNPVKETIEKIPEKLPEKSEKVPEKNEKPVDNSLDIDEETDTSKINEKEQSINKDNSKETTNNTTNEFRRSVNKLKTQVVTKSDDNKKIKTSIQDLSSKTQEISGKIKTIEEKIADKKKELNLLTAVEKEILSKLSDCNLELERMNTINLSSITEKINEKNTDLLNKTTQAKQLKNKYENFKQNIQKTIQEFHEKEKNLASLTASLKKTKEKASAGSSGKKSEIVELATSAEVLKNRLNSQDHPTVKLGRLERSAANEIMSLIREESQKLGTFLRLKLEKQYSQLQERISDKEQELAEAKILFEEEKSKIFQKSRMKKDEILKNGKKKNEIIRITALSENEESVINLKNSLNLARKKENQYYTNSIDLDKAMEKLGVRIT